MTPQHEAAYARLQTRLSDQVRRERQRLARRPTEATVRRIAELSEELDTIATMRAAIRSVWPDRGGPA